MHTEAVSAGQIALGAPVKLHKCSRMNSSFRCGVCAAVFLAVSTFVRAESPAPSFKVGTAKRDITPKEPVPMWGYGARHDALSAGALDSLYATALVIQADTNQLAIVGLDLGRSPSERSLQNIRQRIKADSGIKYSFIAGSHTHHGPVLELADEEGKGKGKFDAAIRYYQQMEDGIVAVITEANSKLTAAKMATGSVKLDGFNRNRHSKIEPKPVDRELAVMRFDDLSDNAGPNKGYEAFGEGSAREVAKLATSLTTREVAQPSLLVREERFKF